MMSAVAISMRSSTNSPMLSVLRLPCPPAWLVRTETSRWRCEGGSTITGSVLDSTRSWVLLRGSLDDSLIMLSAIVAAWPLGRSVAREVSVRGGVGVGHVLRELGARGVGVVVESDGGDHRGIIDAVYADHVDVALDGEAFTYDGRDEMGGMTVSLALAGLRRLRVLGQRWSADY